MKQIYFLSFLLLNVNIVFSQTPFWTETFGSGCSPAQEANAFNPTGNGNWTVSNTGTNDANANKWFISSTEANMGAGACGDGCINNPSLSNRTLHISFDWSSSFPGFVDFGAAYLAGSGFATNKRAESPTINCAGKNNITLSFAYLVGGIVNQDYFDVQYSADNGATWTAIATPTIPNNSTCAGQGIWSSFSVSLPSSANNNPTVKIGFRWQNINSTGADPSVALDDIKLAVPNAFAPTFTLATNICHTNSTTVTANTGTATASGYTWTAQPSGAVISSPNASVSAITFNTPGTFTVTLASTSGTNSGSYSNTIVVGTTPTVQATGTSTICAGQSATLNATGASTYSWVPGNLTGSSVVVSPTALTIYTVNGTSGSCSDDFVITVQVYQTPTVSATANPSMICNGSSATLTASGAGSFTWSPGSSTLSSIVVNPTTTTVYNATGSNGTCTATKALTLTVSPCTDVKEISKEDLYVMYPNPVNDKLFIEVSQAGKFQVQIMDVSGKVVLAELYDASEKIILELNTLSKGIYFLKIRSDQETKVSRFIKQ